MALSTQNLAVIRTNCIDDDAYNVVVGYIEGLLQQDLFQRRILNHIPDMFVLYDRKLRYVMINQSTLDHTGLTEAHFLGKTNEEVFPPEIYEVYQPLLQRVLATRVLTQGTVTLPTPLGERHLLIKYIPIHDEAGHVAYIVGITTDLTREAELEREFQVAVEREKTILMTNFIEAAAHEFKTPLATINSSAYLLGRIDDPQRRADKVAQIQAQVQRTNDLVDHLLAWVKLPDRPQHMGTVALNRLLSAACHDLRVDYPDGPTLHEVLPDDLPHLRGSQTQLQHAFSHLIDNALRFTDIGGSVRVTADHDDGAIWVDIVDTGVGITEAEMDEIFDLFWRKDSARTTSGFGLGLSIARRIIEGHSGAIIVTSEPDHGSTFRVTLPLPADN